MRAWYVAGEMRRTGPLLAALLAAGTLAPSPAAETHPSGPPASSSLGPLEALALAAAGARTALSNAGVHVPYATALDVLRLSREEVAALEAALTAVQRDAVRAVIVAAAEATLLRVRAWASVPPDAAVLVLASPSDALSHLAALDRGLLLAAQGVLVDSVQTNADQLRTVSLEEPICIELILCIGTDGDDVWSDDVQILIEPGGDDLYLNNAGGSLQSVVAASSGGCVLGGGSTGKHRPNLECSPAPSNACTYDTLNRATERDDLPTVGVPGHHDPDGPNGGQGSDGSCGNDDRNTRVIAGASGLAGDDDARAVTLLIDLDGSDIYTVLWSHEDPLFGLIEDCFPGETDKVNTNRDFIQGGSLAGIALAWDAGSGNDVFRGRLNVQGSGHIGGVGMLVVDGDGDTTFWADRLSQASGTAAGIGILVNNASGAQRYLLDPPQVYRNEFAPGARDCQAEGRAGQGQGGFGGVGVLVTDGGSRSHYRAVAHIVENAHPYDAALDANGQPRLARGSDAQGSGESFPLVATSGGIVAGAGILVDRTDGDARACPTHARAGMVNGSTSSSDFDLSTMGVVDQACGKFNLPLELDTGDLATAMQRLLAGAVGVRVVL